jgi:NAD(P)H-quinone oxidoreductase subunit 5
MEFLLPWLAALGPAILLATSLVPAETADRDPGRMRRAATGGALVGGGVGILAAVTMLWTVKALPGTWIHLDAVSATMLLLVGGIGAVVVDYSRRYLDGDPHQGRFMKWIALALGSVLVLVIAGNLILLALAWIGTGVGLQRLLLFYGERKAAQVAARKNLLLSYAGDACMLLAVLVVWFSLGHLSISGIQHAAREAASAGSVGWGVHLAAVLLALAALIKSAQFPFHVWLPEVMETPTPVSALLHAGIINAGGFLLVRLADVVAVSAGALDLLLMLGAFTAMLGAAVMLTQTSVKVNLAWSTVAQMGFMMMQVGLGAFAAALLHIFAHGLYKAHAFLSSGSVVADRRPEKLPPLPFRVLLPALAAAVAVVLLVGWALGMPASTDPGPAVLGAVLVMALVPTLATGAAARDNRAFLLRSLGVVAVVAVLYFGLQLAAAALLAAALPPGVAERTALAPALCVLAVLSFAALLVLNVARRAPVPGRMVEALYVHLMNGLYVNAAANRLIARLKGSN